MKISNLFAGLALSVGALGVANQEPTPSPETEETARVGDPAPAFSLNDQTGSIVTMGGEREGWTVLAFYPKALTGG